MIPLAQAPETPPALGEAVKIGATPAGKAMSDDDLDKLKQEILNQ